MGGGDWSLNRIVPDIIKSVRDNNPLKIRFPYSNRPWQHILEPLMGYIKLAEWLEKPETPNFDIFNFGPNTGNVKTVVELVNQMKLFFPDIRVLEEAPKNREARTLSLDIEKSKKTLGFIPKLDFAETIELTANWYAEERRGIHPLELCDYDIKHFQKNE